MKPFRKQKSKTRSQSSSMTTDCRLFREGTPHTFLQGYLSGSNEGEPKKTTTFRIIPEMFEGEACVPLNPEGGDDPADVFGGTFYFAEIVKQLGPKRMMFVVDAPVDDSGTVNTCYRNPVSEFNWALMWKIKEQLMLKKISRKLSNEDMQAELGCCLDMPNSWFRYIEEGRAGNCLDNPIQVWLVQCVASEINGEKVGKGPLTPSVFAIQTTASTTFLSRVMEREEESEDLSLDNNCFGDFCSPEGGCDTRLSKIVQKSAKDGSSKTAYQLMLRRPHPMSEAQLDKLWVPWEDLLSVPTVEECIGLILEAFGGDEALVGFGLRNSDYVDYLPEEYLEAADGIADARDTRELEKEIADLGLSTSFPKRGSADVSDKVPSRRKKDEDTEEEADDIRYKFEDDDEENGDDEGADGGEESSDDDALRADSGDPSRFQRSMTRAANRARREQQSE